VRSIRRKDSSRKAENPQRLHAREMCTKQFEPRVRKLYVRQVTQFSIGPVLSTCLKIQSDLHGDMELHGRGKRRREPEPNRPGMPKVAKFLVG
jgi:hypothetical protein